MATLEKIRGKAGLLVTVIGVALLAFIVGDLLNSGHTFFRMNQDKVAVIRNNIIRFISFIFRMLFLLSLFLFLVQRYNDFRDY